MENFKDSYKGFGGRWEYLRGSRWAFWRRTDETGMRIKWANLRLEWADLRLKWADLRLKGAKLEA